VRVGVEAGREAIVDRDLHPPGGEPVEEQGREAREQPRLARAAEKEEDGGEEFGGHERRDDERDVARVAGVVGAEGVGPDLREERVVDELDRPNETDKRPRRGPVRGEQRAHVVAGMRLSST